MEKLLEFGNKQVSLSMTVADFDENLFQQFMSKNPVWNFHAISRDDYLHKSKADTEKLVLNYDNQMKICEQITFASFYCLLRCLLRCLKKHSRYFLERKFRFFLLVSCMIFVFMSTLIILIIIFIA